jgi:hypothetical protein
MKDEIGIERDADEPDRLNITIPDPRPDAEELSAMRATVRAAVAGTAPLPGESEAQYRARIHAACVGLHVPSELLR